MNISPKRDIEGAKTDITVMAIAPLTNTLDKEQKLLLVENFQL